MSRTDKMSVANIVLCVAAMVFGFIAAGSRPDDIPLDYSIYGALGTATLCAGIYFLGRTDEARKQAKA